MQRIETLPAIYDDNKAISSIAYNYLNLPSVITITGKGSISYTYDASGNKLRKTTTENASVANKNITTTTTTDYTGGLVYESKSDNDPNTADYANRLQFGGMEEGRIRAVYANAQTPDLPTNFVYDYFLKDHLGNVRMVLTEEQQKDIYPAATLETNLVATEGNYYNIDASKIEDNIKATGIPAYLNNNTIANNNPGCTGTLCTIDNSQKVYRMNGNENKTGLGITLKVMAGDKLDIFGKSYYFQNNAGGRQANTAVPIVDLLAGFLGGPLGTVATGAHGAVTAAQINTPAGITGINTLLTNQTNQSNTSPVVPKAFINYIFFDEQFKAVGSGFSQVNPLGGLYDHHNDPNMQNINVPKNGFVYIYCSNESPVNVFFDNLQVVMTRGPILEETHYYPFGLTMSGISSKAAGKLENKYKYNSIELNNDFDLNIYDAHFRNLDPQIGRFWQIDPKLESAESWSPYAAMLDNPIRYSDPLGDSAAWFRPDGSFWKFADDGKKEWSGVFYQKSTTTSTYEKDGVQYEVKTYSGGVNFQFNDPGVDVLAIKNGVESGGRVGITGIETLSDDKANAQIDRSGVKSAEAQNSPLSYAKNQGAKKMDYGVQGIINGDLDPKKFYLRGGVAYNVGDAGNYLWGRGMGYLGTPLGVAQLGAHYNNIFHGKDQKTQYYDFGKGTYGAPGFWDSPGDQRAIINGYNNSPAVIEAYKKSMDKLSNGMKGWKPN